MEDLIFWFDNPPGISRGVFNEVSNIWDGKCFYIAIKDTREERKAINWDEGGYGRAELIVLEKEANPELFISNFLEQHKNDIHIFTGYKGLARNYLNSLIRMKQKYIYIWAEGPVMCGIKRKIIVNILHRYYAMLYRKKVRAMFPLGMNGMNMYNILGWKKEQLFPFLYLPLNNTIIERKRRKTTGFIKFIYIGRFSKTKGLKILMSACDQLDSKGWSLDLVGGYGELADQVQDWIKSKSNISFLGKWNINEVEDNLQDYDVCIVPSLFDGWNVTVNKALNANIGVITTDAAGSNDMVSASGAGIVVEAGKSQELAKAMKFTIDNYNVVENWKEKAKIYMESWNEKDCAKYFIDVLLYTQGKIKTKPGAPWLL